MISNKFITLWFDENEVKSSLNDKRGLWITMSAIGNPFGLLLSFLIPLFIVDQRSTDRNKQKVEIFWLMFIEGIPSVLVAILTLLFWFKGKSRETIMVLEGKMGKDTIIDDRFQTVSLLKQCAHIFSRFNLVLMILNAWVHNGFLQSYSSQIPQILNTFGIPPVINQHCLTLQIFGLLGNVCSITLGVLGAVIYSRCFLHYPKQYLGVFVIYSAS